MTYTYGDALSLIGVAVPGHLLADAEVPVLSGPQAQGDLMVFPTTEPDGLAWEPVPEAGVQVVHGEATGNTHWLHRGFASPDVEWADGLPELTGRQLLGYLRVPDGQSAMLIHTDEHGANGIGPGTYAVHRKRQWGPSGEGLVGD